MAVVRVDGGITINRKYHRTFSFRHTRVGGYDEFTGLAKVLYQILIGVDVVRRAAERTMISAEAPSKRKL